MKSIAPSTTSTTTTTTTDDDITFDNIQKSFDNILLSLKETTSITTNDKTSLLTEINLLYSDIKLSKDNMIMMMTMNSISNSNSKTSLYSSSSSPYCIVTSNGIISNDINKFFNDLGKAARVTYINTNNLPIMPDNELNYAIRDAKTIIIINDNDNTNKGNSNWFNNNNDNDSITDIIELPEKSLKRLLNAVMNERNKSSSNYNPKVVALCKATKQAKSLGSLLSGDSTDFDSELILKCTQRGIGYTIIKVGNVIDDDKEITANVKRRSLLSQLKPLTKKEEERVVSPVPPSSIVFTRSRIEASECTRRTVAKEALLRAAVYPNNNSTISVVSDQLGPVTDAEWDDEFLKLDGPELHRIPLRFASVLQTTLKLGRIALDLQQPKSGLITPIQVERFSNGVRILFQPKESGYLSSKEEKLKEIEENENLKKAKARKSGYISPEEELKQAAAAAVSTATSVEKSPKKKVEQLEGGLEVVVDTTPYRRVRIRRCNMGPQTIVKEESEAILIKALLQGIAVLENDYRILLTKDLESLQTLK